MYRRWNRDTISLVSSVAAVTRLIIVIIIIIIIIRIRCLSSMPKSRTIYTQRKLTNTAEI